MRASVRDKNSQQTKQWETGIYQTLHMQLQIENCKLKIFNHAVRPLTPAQKDYSSRRGFARSPEGERLPPAGRRAPLTRQFFDVLSGEDHYKLTHEIIQSLPCAPPRCRLRPGVLALGGLRRNACIRSTAISRCPFCQFRRASLDITHARQAIPANSRLGEPFRR